MFSAIVSIMSPSDMPCRIRPSLDYLGMTAIDPKPTLVNAGLDSSLLFDGEDCPYSFRMDLCFLVCALDVWIISKFLYFVDVDNIFWHARPNCKPVVWVQIDFLQTIPIMSS